MAEEQQVDDPCAPAIVSVGGKRVKRGMRGGCGIAWRRRLRRRGLTGARTVGSISGCRIPTTTGPRSPRPSVGRGYIHNTDTATYTRGGKEFNRNEEYHSASTPELSIVSRLRVEVGCDAAGANCAHSLDSTPGSFKPYYRSYFTGRENGADTEALLVPANYCTECRGNAEVVGWLDIGEDHPHTYRIHMTAGKTYVFDDLYRKWALTSGEWRGGPHFYIPDEFRISLFTKNSGGELVPVSDFQDQPENGWQAIQDDGADDYQAYGQQSAIDRPAEFFAVLTNLKFVFEHAHLYPPGNRYRHICNLDKTNACGAGLDIYWYDGRQLRNAIYTPTETRRLLPHRHPHHRRTTRMA